MRCAGRPAARHCAAAPGDNGADGIQGMSWTPCPPWMNHTGWENRRQVVAAIGSSALPGASTSEAWTDPRPLYGPLPPGSGPARRAPEDAHHIVNEGIKSNRWRRSITKSAAPGSFSFLWTLLPQFHTLLQSRRQNMKYHYRSEPVRKSVMVRDATHIGRRGWPRQKLTFFSPGV